MDPARFELLYHFCRLQTPAIFLTRETCKGHLQRAFGLAIKKDRALTWMSFFDQLYPVDWYMACACLEGNGRAWEALFAARAGRSDCLLTDALRARANRLYPRDEERQENAVVDFWGHLYVSETPGSVPILARFDGIRPLIPWLIRVFQNWHISQLRRPHFQSLPSDDLSLPMPAEPNGRWHETFIDAARAWLSTLDDPAILLLGLRLRYRLSQREVAHFLGVHEGTVSRRTDQLRDLCLEQLGNRLLQEGWTGDDLFEFVRAEMYNVLLDDPQLSIDHLARILANQGRAVPA